MHWPSLPRPPAAVNTGVVAIDRSPQLAAGAAHHHTPGTRTGGTAPAFPFLTERMGFLHAGPWALPFYFTFFTFNFLLSCRAGCRSVLHWAYARIAQLSTLERCMHVDR